MKIKTLGTFVAAVVLLGSLFFVQADDKKAGKDPRAEKFRVAEEKIWGAVKAGKLSKEDAMKKLKGLKDQIWSGDLKNDWDGKKDRDGKKGHDGKPASDIEVLKRQLEALKRENEGLRKRLEKRKDR